MRAPRGSQAPLVTMLAAVVVVLAATLSAAAPLEQRAERRTTNAAVSSDAPAAVTAEATRAQVQRRAEAALVERQARLQALARRADRERARLVKLAANPLANRRWGVYQGPLEQTSKPYFASSGSTRALLSKIALRPKTKWFGMWVSPSGIEASVRGYVDNASGGDRETLVQMALFAMEPWEHEACRRLPSAREQSNYRRWIDGVARGIGAQHTAVILQPDGPFEMCAPGNSSIPSQLIAYGAKTLSALPHTSVYIDGGAADWPPGNPSAAVDFLIRDGIRYARGVALNSTHYSATGDEVDRAAAIVEGLAARGIAGKHAVINTSSNGRPFVFGDAPGRDPDNATVCRSRSDSHCVTLGIPPTADVASTRWPLSAAQRAKAREIVDGYLWFGRPWLYRQNNPFDMGRALSLVRSTPY